MLIDEKRKQYNRRDIVPRLPGAQHIVESWRQVVAPADAPHNAPSRAYAFLRPAKGNTRHIPESINFDTAQPRGWWIYRAKSVCRSATTHRLCSHSSCAFFHECVSPHAAMGYRQFRSNNERPKPKATILNGTLDFLKLNLTKRWGCTWIRSTPSDSYIKDLLISWHRRTVAERLQYR